MLYVQLSHDDAKMPSRGSKGAAGLDLSSVENVDIPPGGRALVSTGLCVQVPLGCYGRIAPRSGLAWKHGIDVLAGVVDHDYAGTVMVVLINTDSENTFRVNVGDRIAQLILEKILWDNEVEIRAVDELPYVFGMVSWRGAPGFGGRGTNGFGSTGA